MLRVTRTRPVKIKVTVSFSVADGSASKSELNQWINEALYRYHRDRAGWVGYDMCARITRPKVDDDG